MKKEMIAKWTSMFNEGEYEQLERTARFYLMKHPGSGMAYKGLSAALQVQGKDAMQPAKMAAELLVTDVEAQFNYGVILQKADKLDDAIAQYRKALAVKPNYAPAYNNMGNALKDSCRAHESILAYRRVLEIDPTLVEAYLNMGNSLGGIGLFKHAISAYRHGLMLKPDFEEIYTSLIFTTDLMSGPNAADAHAVRREWYENCIAKLGRYSSYENDLSTDRRLRIGYVSADFKEHSAARSFGGMLTWFNPLKFEVYAYCNNEKKGDDFTKMFREGVTAWRETRKMADSDLAELIRQDKIDILVDLSGHTQGNRLQVFARKPAPIQITAWGYASGTGMDAMDVLFSDEVVIPPDEQKHYTEEIRYLPSLLGTFFSQNFPECAILPALESKWITFGSLNRIAKLTDETFDVWAQILLRVPDSRLLLKCGGMDDKATKENVLWKFGRVGIEPWRINIHGASPWWDHVNTNNKIDIGLDPFPHGGGMTSLEGFVMGVPTVTLRCSTIAGRLGASFNKSLGMEDWTAETKEQYIEIAVTKAADRQALAKLRAELPGRFDKSAIGDANAYTRAVEAEYRFLWERWCAKTVEKTGT